MGWEHYRTVDPSKTEPQVGRGLFSVYVLILHFKFQFSKSIKSSTFHIFHNLTYPFRGIQRCLKRDRGLTTLSLVRLVRQR